MNPHPLFSNPLPRFSPRQRRAFMALLLSVACFLAAIALLPGCATGSAAGLVNALGADTNAVQVNVMSPWGTVEVRRNLPPRQ